MFEFAYCFLERHLGTSGITLVEIIFLFWIRFVDDFDCESFSFSVHLSDSELRLHTPVMPPSSSPTHRTPTPTSSGENAYRSPSPISLKSPSPPPKLDSCSTYSRPVVVSPDMNTGSLHFHPMNRVNSSIEKISVIYIV